MPPQMYVHYLLKAIAENMPCYLLQQLLQLVLDVTHEFDFDCVTELKFFKLDTNTTTKTKSNQATCYDIWLG